MYSAWSAWTVSISASTQTIAASGGSSTITTNASRSRTWTWNGVGTTHTDTETATPTLSGSAGGFTLSGKTVTASNNTTTNSRSITITATSNSVSKSITITQSAGAKVYGNWSAWTVNISADKTSIGATGGTATISTSASRTRSYTWNGVAGSGGTETGNGSPALSKVSGSGNWTSPKVTYGNNTSTSGKSTVIRATIDSTTKDITISQSAGAKQYSAWSAWTVNISNSGNVAASGGSSNITTSASRTRTWTWNGVSGSGGTDTTYASAKDVAIVSQSNCTTTVKDTGSNNIIMFSSVVPANLSSSARTWYFNWRWLGSNDTTIINTQAANTLRGRLAIKNDYFTSQNVALPIYLDSQNVDLIYKGEASYNDIKKTPIGVYVYIPTNTAIMNAGKLQFWLEDKNGSSNKYTCTLSNISTPSNNVSVSNSNNIINVTANTTTSSFTILCQFTMTSNSTVFNVRVLIEP